MPNSKQAIGEIVIEALTARGWSKAEAEQIIIRLRNEGPDARYEQKTIVWSNCVVPFGKYKNRTLLEIIEREDNIGYLHWLVRTDWVQEQYPILYHAALKCIAGVYKEDYQHEA